MTPPAPAPEGFLDDATACVLCGAPGPVTLLRHRYDHPGVSGDLVDLRYERLWILFERLLRGRESAEFRVERCERCGLVFLNPRWTPEAMRAKYEAIEELGSVKRRLALRPYEHLEERSSRVYELASAFLPRSGPTSPRVLDYGGARGYLLRGFLRHGFDGGVLDYEDWGTELEPGASYLGRDLGDLDPSARFDAVLLVHTLEHLVDPGALVRDLAGRLTPDGILLVEVPLGVFGEYRRLADPLTHVNFFSEQSLCRVLEDAGLSVAHVSTRHQWVGHAPEWCVNAVATPGRVGRPVRPRTTAEQSAGPLWWTYRLGHGLRTAARLLAERAEGRR